MHVTRAADGDQARRKAGSEATALTVTTMSLLAAFAGMEHGIGEVLQGPVAPPAPVFRSLGDTPAFSPLNGEPALTLIPNLLVSGILAVTVSLCLALWSVLYVHRPHGARGLAVLAVVLLLVGGGFGPPVLAILAALLATRIGFRARRRPNRMMAALAALWPWPLVVLTAFFLALVPGTALLYLVWRVDSLALVAVLIVGAFSSVPLAWASARGRDLLMRSPGRDGFMGSAEPFDG